MEINCIIIDDEPSSQSILENFIAKIPFLKLSGTCNNALEASTVLKLDTTIDLLFLDINMPTISGLDFYKSLAHPPKVIFTTAYAHFALDGFEVNAIDYLLKPFSFERFLAAVHKAADQMVNSQAGKAKNEHLIIKVNKTLHKVPVESIYYLEALGDYVKVHLKDSFLLTNSTFSNILKALPNNQFTRVHKSYAIHLDKLNSVSGNKITLDTYIIPIGQTYKSDFLKLIS